MFLDKYLEDFPVEVMVEPFKIFVEIFKQILVVIPQFQKDSWIYKKKAEKW